VGEGGGWEGGREERREVGEAGQWADRKQGSSRKADRGNFGQPMIWIVIIVLVWMVLVGSNLREEHAEIPAYSCVKLKLCCAMLTYVMLS
jgi:hypothetical protein